MALYRFILDYQKYTNFHDTYGKYVRTNFHPDNVVTIDTTSQQGSHSSPLFGNKTPAFKLRPLTPDFVVDEFITKCWTAYIIKNEQKYKFWLPMAKFIGISALIFYALSFIWLTDTKGNSFSELWYTFASIIGIATLLTCGIAWTMDDNSVELSDGEKIQLIRSRTHYPSNISQVLKNLNSSYPQNSHSFDTKAQKNELTDTEMISMLRKLKEQGIDGKALATYKDEEREKLFIEHFGDEEKGKIASDRFNRTYIYPARKDILNKLINEEEFEDNSIKTNLLDKVKSFNNAISKDEFDGIVREIVTFKEKKKRIDNHVKYEGRLSNKDIQAIKEHFGYICMACGLNPAEEYGKNMKGIMEAHHKKPYAEIEAGESRTVEPDDFLILCPTCHRLIHKLASPDDLDGLKELVNKPIRSSWWD